MSAAATVDALKSRVARDVALVRNARDGTAREAWVKADVVRIDALFKCALVTLAGAVFGCVGVTGLGHGIWGLFFAYFVSQVCEMYVMKVDVDRFGDPLEFLLNAAWTQTFLLCASWATFGAMTGKLPQQH